MPPPLRPAVVVASHARPASLARLLRSLNAAHYDGSTPLVISIDAHGEPRVRDVAESHRWPHGPKRVSLAEEQLGLVEHLRRCGDLSTEYGAVLLLEDDLYVAPGYYRFARAALARYAEEPRVAGVSFACPTFNETAWLPFTPLGSPSDAFFMQPLYSGGAWTAEQWRRFRTWLRDDDRRFDDPRIPPNVRAWPASSSFKRDVFKHVIQGDLYYAHPRESYVTNFAERGTNFQATNNLFQVPLCGSSREPELPAFEECEVRYDAWFEAAPSMLAGALEPWLHGEPFCVDLYGTRDPEIVKEPFTLTIRPTRAALRTFGLRMRPREANVLAGVEGDEIRLARTQDVVRGDVTGYRLRAEAAYQAAHVNLRFVGSLVAEKLVRRLRRPS